MAWVFVFQLGELGLDSGMSLRRAVSASPPPHLPLPPVYLRVMLGMYSDGGADTRP